jgi:nitrogen fixation protein NifQ
VAPRAIPDPAAVELSAELAGGASGGFVSSAAKAYFDLTGVAPNSADIRSDDDFDRHVVASILALSASEGGALHSQCGLAEAQLGEAIARFFPASRLSVGAAAAVVDAGDADEIEIVRDLLTAHLSSDGDCGRWLAAMLARRAQEPNHLWEDLGLRNRGELTRLMDRHFATLAVRNDKNMRWKRFIYRVMCEDDGFVMCSTPVCTNCADYAICFGVDGGESRVAVAPEGGDKSSR